jgi:hypothetical protein
MVCSSVWAKSSLDVVTNAAGRLFKNFKSKPSKTRQVILVTMGEKPKSTAVMSELFKKGYEQESPEFALSGAMAHAENLSYAVRERSTHNISFNTGGGVKFNSSLPAQTIFNISSSKIGLGAVTNIEIYEEIRSTKRLKGILPVPVPTNVDRSRLKLPVHICMNEEGILWGVAKLFVGETEVERVGLRTNNLVDLRESKGRIEALEVRSESQGKEIEAGVEELKTLAQLIIDHVQGDSSVLPMVRDIVKTDVEEILESCQGPGVTTAEVEEALESLTNYKTQYVK